MCLIDSIKMSLTPFHIEKIQQIDDFDFSKTAKKVNHDLHGITSQYLMDGIENLKKYYVVALLDPLNEHAVSRLVDPFWHAHILHTKEYFQFCNSIFGQYIHHKPLDPTDFNEVSEISKLYDYTIQIYDKMFHQIDKNWWPDLNTKSFGFVFGPGVCRHMNISNIEITAEALFPRNYLLSVA